MVNINLASTRKYNKINLKAIIGYKYTPTNNQAATSIQPN